MEFEVIQNDAAPERTPVISKQLRDELSDYGENPDVVLVSEEGRKIRYFDIIGLSLRKGTPSRDANNKPQFSFDPNGSSTKLFISITEDF